MVRKGNLAVIEDQQKGAKSPKPKMPHPPKLVCMRFTTTSTCMNILSQFYFLTPMDYMVRKGNLAVFEGKQKGAKSPKPKMPHPSKLVCMHFTTTSTCMNILSQFYFLTPMDYSPWSEREIWPFLKASKKGQNLRHRRCHTLQNWFACVSQLPLLA